MPNTIRVLLLLATFALASVPVHATIYAYDNTTWELQGSTYNVHSWVYMWTDHSCCEYENGADWWLDIIMYAGASANDTHYRGSYWSASGEIDCVGVEPNSYITIFADVTFEYWSMRNWEQASYDPYYQIDSSPQFYSVTPNQAEPGDSGELDVTGDYLNLGPVSLFQSTSNCGLTIGSPLIGGSRYSKTFPYSVAAQAPTNPCGLKLSNAYGWSGEQGFQVALYEPTIFSVDPGYVVKGGPVTTVHIVGANFYPEETQITGCNLEWSITSLTKDQISVSTSAPPGATPGPCTIRVGHRGGWTPETPTNFSIQ